MKNIVIFGASGHGSVILDCLERQKKYHVVGFLDSYKKKGSLFCGYEILGSEIDLPLLKDKHNLIGGIVAIGDNWIRNKIVTKILNVWEDFDFVTAIHPRAIVGKNVIIGQGTVLMPGSIVNANSIVGDFCILNTNCSLGHDGRMMKYSSLAPGVCAGGNLKLGIYSSIGLGSNVIEGISIGGHSVIGAGSLVIDNVPDHVVAFGNPAKIIRQRQVGEPYLSVRKKPVKYTLLQDDLA